MKIYTLIHISLDTNKTYHAGTTSNILLFSDKYAKILEGQQQQKNLLIKHLTETLDKKDIQISERSTYPGVPLNDIFIQAGSIKHMLLVSIIETEPKSSETKETYNPGDLVTLKNEAKEAIQIMEYNNTGYNGPTSKLLVAKVLEDKGDTLKILNCAVKTSTTTDTTGMGVIRTVAKEYVRKLYV